MSVYRKLYWADVKLSKIIVSEMNGTLQYAVVSDGLSSPRAIVVHPLLGYDCVCLLLLFVLQSNSAETIGDARISQIAKIVDTCGHKECVS